MSVNLPNFEKAQYAVQPAAMQPQILSGDLDGRAWDVQRSDHARFTQALLYGIGAAIAGSIVYAAFTIVTHIEIGYLAVGVGYLVGKAMLHATQGLGGRKYQVVSAILTYFAVAMAAVPEILWSLRSRGMDITHLRAGAYFQLAKYGAASPLLELHESLGSGLIGLFILFIGIRAAWKFTADRRIPA